MKVFKIALVSTMTLTLLLTAIVFGPWLWGWYKGSGSFPTLSGQYDVGLMRLEVVDETRQEIFADDEQGVEHRKLMVTAYYPAVPDKKMPPQPYGPQAEIRAVTGVPPLLARPFKRNAIVGASVRSGSYPVIVFSPGLDGTTLFYSSFLEQVASHGYILLAVDHPYTASAVQMDTHIRYASKAGNHDIFHSDEDIRTATRIRVTDVWAKDHSAALDALIGAQEFDSLNANSALDNVGVMGHSFGGQAAAYTMLLDQRFKYGLNFDGSYMTEQEQLLSPGQRFCHVFSYFHPPYDWLSDHDMTYDQWHDRWRIKNYPDNLKGKNHDVYTFFNIRHESFVSDFLIFKDLLPALMDQEIYGTVASGEMIQSMTELALHWFSDDHSMAWSNDNKLVHHGSPDMFWHHE